jgi:muramoyltetrapeptide carboxypeptidase
MNTFRRKLLGASIGTLVGGRQIASAMVNSGGEGSESALEIDSKVVPRLNILPPALKKGSVVAITAPASGINLGEIQDGIEALKANGCEVVVGKAIYKKYGYLSAPDQERAAELMEFIERPDINCILCARGGYGVMRILPMLDFAAIKKNPKIIVGYSDITALLIAIYNQTKIVTFHGPVASSTFDTFTLDYFLKTLFIPKSTENTGKISSLAFPPITFSDSRLITLTGGTARGNLVGGNLAMIVSTLGTPYEVDTKGAIFFLEEVSEEPYKIDRMLTQLWLAGKFQHCAGIALGQFKNCEATSKSGFDISFTLQQVLESRIQTLGIPSVYGLPFGHVKSKMTLPIGVQAELNATDKTFTIIEPSVTV